MKHIFNIISFCIILTIGNFITDTTKFNGKNLCHIITAPVTKKIPVTSNTGLDQATFNNVIDSFVAVYKPIVKQKGYNLVVSKKWSDETINSDTTVNGKNWLINAYGGLARYPSMDADTYLTVLLHEIGHHLGGYPANGWASNEGESDYYATLKGFRIMLYSGYKPSEVFSVPESVIKACSLMFKSQEEINLCEKEAALGYNLANILNELSGASKPISFDLASGPKVTRTNDNHPEAQCRLHTYYNGALCPISYTEELSADSPIPGACAEEKGDKIGIRDRCWYKPKL